MSPEDLGRDVTEFEPVGAAVVRGFRLGFTRYSRARRGGVADLVPDLDKEVEGVLYRLPLSQLPALDEREGAPDNYRRDFIAVRTPDGKMYDRVLTYVVADKLATDVAPHSDYAATILTGAEAYLSQAYVRSVRQFIELLMTSPHGKAAARQAREAAQQDNDSGKNKHDRDKHEQRDRRERKERRRRRHSRL